MYSSAGIIIRAWFLDRSDVVFTEEFTVNQSDEPLLSVHPNIVYDIDSYIVHVQVNSQIEGHTAYLDVEVVHNLPRVINDQECRCPLIGPDDLSWCASRNELT